MKSRSFFTEINKKQFTKNKTKHNSLKNKYEINQLFLKKIQLAFGSSIWFVTRLESIKINQMDPNNTDLLYGI